jgi:hypothetical protein
LWNGIEYRYDQYGLRNEVDVESAEVVVVGDSFVEGLGVSPADILTNQLARQLNRPVANLAQSWYGPQQELELLRRYGLRMNPKVCVWVFFEGNDLTDVSRYKMATQDWETYSKDFHSFRQRSFTKNAVLAFQRLVQPILKKEVSLVNYIKEHSGFFSTPFGQKTRLTFHYGGYHLSENDRTAIKTLAGIIGQANSLCSVAGAKFLLVFAPTKFRVYKNFTEFDAQTQARYWVINDLPQRLEAMVHEELIDAEFLDLTAAFVGHAKQEALLYFDYDSHWSPEGHRVAASAIANSLKQWE